MTSLVVGSNLLFSFIEHVTLALGSEHHLFYRAYQVVLRDRTAVFACGQNGALVHEAVEVGTGKARRAFSNDLKIYIFCKRLFTRVDLQNLKAVATVRELDNDPAVKTAGAQERWVQDVGPVGCRHDNHLFIRLKTVHFDQNLVEGLLALVVAAAYPRAPPAAHGINLVDKDNRGRCFFGG